MKHIGKPRWEEPPDEVTIPGDRMWATTTCGLPQGQGEREENSPSQKFSVRDNQNKQKVQSRSAHQASNFGMGYKARTPNRFLAEDIMACIASAVRRLAELLGTRAAMRRPGFFQDMKALANAKAEEFEEAAGLIGPHGGIREALQHEKVSKTVKQALQQLMFTTANVPATEGHKVSDGARCRLLQHPPSCALPFALKSETVGSSDPTPLALVFANSESQAVARSGCIRWPT